MSDNSIVPINNNTKQFLDKVGLLALWDKICETIGIAVDKYIPETVNTTYAELVELRNNGELKPGEKYRITDYVTTVSSNQMDIISGEHRFDIIVEALDNCTLSEQAKAARHADDEYFETENLEAWQLWYCLDNDKKRFEWADDGTVDYKAEFIGAYTVDLYGNNKGEYRIDKEPYIYECSWLPHPDTGDDCIVLYTQDPMYYAYEGADYRDAYFYEGTITVDGQEFDSWKKYDIEIDDWVTVSNDNFRYYCLLTERMVFNDEVIWPAQLNTSGGKGVIYRMIDEYGNDCPYDFKNIKYHSDGMGTYVYTFTWIDEYYNVIDTSVFGNNGVLTCYGEIYGVHSNVIKPYYITDYDNPDENTGIVLCKQALNNITFISDYLYEGVNNDGFYGCANNTFGNNCHSNSFGNGGYSNIFCDNCYYNSFGDDCNYNSLGNGCNYNIFDTGCSYNRFDSYCYSNSLGNSCAVNNFGNFCHSNSFGDNCSYNSFGNGCYSNIFGNDVCYNSFGNLCGVNNFGQNCNYNSFGNYCSNNVFVSSFSTNRFSNNCNYNNFGRACHNNSFGNSCNYNNLGDGCNYNSFGNDCSYNSFRIDANTYATLLNYCKYNRFDDGCSYNILHGDSQTGYFCNLHIVRGVCGNNDSPNYINVAVSENATYEIKVAKNSNGNIKVYCEADLIA